MNICCKDTSKCHQHIFLYRIRLVLNKMSDPELKWQKVKQNKEDKVSTNPAEIRMMPSSDSELSLAHGRRIKPRTHKTWPLTSETQHQRIQISSKEPAISDILAPYFLTC